MLTTEEIRSALGPLHPESLAVEDISGNCGTSFRIEVLTFLPTPPRLKHEERLSQENLNVYVRCYVSDIIQGLCGCAFD